MSKQVSFIVPITVDPEYKLNSRDLNKIEKVFQEVYPGHVGRILYDEDEPIVNPYFIAGDYCKYENDMGDIVKHEHYFSKIVDLPNNFTLDQVLQAVSIPNLKHHNIKTISKI